MSYEWKLWRREILNYQVAPSVTIKITYGYLVPANNSFGTRLGTGASGSPSLVFSNELAVDMNDEFQRLWKDDLVTYLKATSQHFPGETEGHDVYWALCSRSRSDSYWAVTLGGTRTFSSISYHAHSPTFPYLPNPASFSWQIIPGRSSTDSFNG